MRRVSTDIDVLKERIITAVQVLLHEEVIDAFGHVSVRIPGTDHVVIQGHTHLGPKPMQRTDVSDVVTIDLTGQRLEGSADPPGERFIHTGIYRMRPDVGAVVHLHPPIAIAFSASGRPILPVWTQGSVFAPAVPIHEYPGQIDTAALGDEVARTLSGHAALLLRAHGAVTVGRTLEEACVIAVNLERNAKIQWIAECVGTPRSIESGYLDGAMMKGVPSEEYVNAYWTYYLERMHSGRR
jgi:L-ribulose-5-phosphate 4-epimerase